MTTGADPDAVPLERELAQAQHRITVLEGEFGRLIESVYDFALDQRHALADGSHPESEHNAIWDLRERLRSEVEDLPGRLRR